MREDGDEVMPLWELRLGTKTTTLLTTVFASVSVSATLSTSPVSKKITPVWEDYHIR